jgi:hypothetical protein
MNHYNPEMGRCAIRKWTVGRIFQDKLGHIADKLCPHGRPRERMSVLSCTSVPNQRSPGHGSLAVSANSTDCRVTGTTGNYENVVAGAVSTTQTRPKHPES